MPPLGTVGIGGLAKLVCITGTAALNCVTNERSVTHPTKLQRRAAIVRWLDGQACGWASAALWLMRAHGLLFWRSVGWGGTLADPESSGVSAPGLAAAAALAPSWLPWAIFALHRLQLGGKRLSHRIEPHRCRLH